MKKVYKVFLLIFSVIILLLIGGCFLYYALTFNVKIDENKLINLDRSVAYYYDDGEKITEISNNTKVISYDELNDYTLNAFVAVEDKRFYEHKGIDFKRLLSATFNNLTSFSFKEGASTITQQLIKNTHLSSEKTITRKLMEINLAQKLEKMYSKKQILEMYLNTIYFGDNCYGITAASEHYFNKSPKNLTINESATLAGIIKAPSHYSPIVALDRCFDRKNIVLKLMKDQGYIDNETYAKLKTEQITLCQDFSSVKEYDYLHLTNKQRGEFELDFPYAHKQLKVNTNCNKNYQNILKNAVNSIEGVFLKSAILLDKNNNVKAYYSNCGDVSRQLGSTLKPLAVYAPAIENDVVNSYTHIIDEKINIGGYSPANYKEKYYGKITVKESLAKSLNSCAVKILNYTGIEKSMSYLNKTQLDFNESDKTLALALGACKNGNSLSKLTAAYTVFINNGYYKNINTLKEKNDNNVNVKVFSDDTTSIINDILKYAVKNGTAKRLSDLPFSVYAKTGTVGTDAGNTDAYVISYTSDYVLGCWIGCKEKLLDNNVTGGTTPCIVAKEIWKEIYKKKKPEDIILSNNLTLVDVDKISYNEDDLIQLADKYAPERYVERLLVKKKNVPSSVSDRFSRPKIKSPDLSVQNNEIKISLCLPEYYKVELYRSNSNKKTIIKTLSSSDSVFVDTKFKLNTEYTYYAIPYYVDKNGDKIYGDEIVIGKIKTPSNLLGEDWWNEFC